MPFTLAHPAAVLPLRRLGITLALPPLVAGSMAPDLPYFVPIGAKVRGVTHDLTGALTLDILLAVVILALGVFVAGPLARLLPPRWDCLASGWTAEAWPRSWRGLPSWYAGPALGALTHVVWDAFTHPDGYVVERWAALRSQLGPAPVYTWLQDGFSVLGMLVVTWALWRAAARLVGQPSEVGVSSARRLVCALLLMAAVAGALAKTFADSNPDNVRFELVTGAGAGIGLALVAYAAAVQLQTRRR